MNFLRRILPQPLKDVLRPFYRGLLSFGGALLYTVLRLLRIILGAQLFLRIGHVFARHADQTLTIDGIVFDAREPRPLERAVTLHSKEPDTINWLRDHIKPGDVFYDVGANIGVFTLYAAKKLDAAVLAFEPMAANYAILNSNIFLNDLSKKAQAFNLALDHETSVSLLHLSGVLPGKAGHGFSPDEGFQSFVEQGAFGISLDAFVFDFQQAFPAHIKVDVDGNEPRIVQGMQRVLSDPRLKTIAIELGPEERPKDFDVIEGIKGHGFELQDDPRYENITSVAWTTVRNYFFARV